MKVLNSMLIVQFFRRLRKSHKKLFYLFAIATFFQLLFIGIKLNAFPFLLYGMFSEKAAPPEVIRYQEVLLDTIPLADVDLSERKRLLLTGALRHYVAVLKNGGTDIVESRVESRYQAFVQTPVYPWIKQKVFNQPAALDSFGVWFRQQCTKVLDREIDSIRVIEHTYRPGPDYSSLIPLSREQVVVF